MANLLIRIKTFLIGYLNMNCNDKIFGTPPVQMTDVIKESFFMNDLENQIEEWIAVLVRENEKLKNEAHLEEGLVLSDSFAYLNTVCKKFHLSPEVKFLALDIYQTFSLLHIDSVTRVTSQTSCKQEDPKNFFLRVLQKVGWQAPLRALTCLWIAAKVTSHKKGIHGKAIQTLLNESGIIVSLKTITKSELRILEQIGFNSRRCNTILEYLNILVTFVAKAWSNPLSCGIKLDANQVNSLFDTSLRMVEMIYLNYDIIYHELFYKVTGSRVVSKDLTMHFSRVRCDRLLLAASVVASAGYLHGKEPLYKPLVRDLSSALTIPIRDIATFASCIIRHILCSNSDVTT